MAYLKGSPRDLANMKEIWIRDGVFEVSRHRLDYSFGEPIHDYSPDEKEALQSTSDELYGHSCD